MDDHDQRLKTLLREFIYEFFLLFFPNWALHFDLSTVEWLEQEVFPDPPTGERRVLDLLAKVRVRADTPIPGDWASYDWMALIHIEVESAESRTRIKRRFPSYYENLMRKHELPVLPFCVYINIALRGVGVDSFSSDFGSFQVRVFNYHYVGLPGLNAVEYVDSEYLLGAALAAMMRIPDERRAWLKAHALQRIAVSAHNEQQKHLLSECVEAYLDLDPHQQIEFEQMLNSKPYEEAKKMATTTFEKGIEKGIEKGMAKGQREIVYILLEDRFGPINEELRKRIDEWPTEQLADLAKRVSRAESLDEVGLDQ